DLFAVDLNDHRVRSTCLERHLGAEREDDPLFLALYRSWRLAGLELEPKWFVAQSLAIWPLDEQRECVPRVRFIPRDINTGADAEAVRSRKSRKTKDVPPGAEGVQLPVEGFTAVREDEKSQLHGFSIHLVYVA